MQTLAVVSKSTKQGLSVWRFVRTETGEYFAFGGIKPACKAFADIDELRACYKNWRKYGYKPGIQAAPTPTRPEKPSWDGPARPLTEDLIKDLWALEPTVA